MKRLWACLLAVLLLAGCGAERTDPPAGEYTMPEIGIGQREPAGEFTLTTEWESYDPSVNQVWFLLTNEGDEDAEVGTEYALETLGDNGTWYQVPFVENGAVGEFTLKEGSAVSAERPCGFEPLEDLPDDYGAANAAEGDVIYTSDGVKNGEAVEAFLNKVCLGVPCQLRTVRDCSEGTPMIIDVMFQNDQFLWRMRNNGEIAEQRFSYIVTDGRNLYLSNGADWVTAERYAGKELACLAPEGTATPGAVGAVEQMTAERLAGNVARYRVWSTDGEWGAALTDVPTAFSVSWRKPGEGSGGHLYDLRDWDGLETAILGLEWREDGALLLICGTAGGGTASLLFDPEAEVLTEVPGSRLSVEEPG